ncbi:MAG: diguanylate cyclase [Rhodospirillales bacterium]|nr:MAG: diguanylate cyclase [Rhodospirillales bacterium]
MSTVDKHDAGLSLEAGGGADPAPDDRPFPPLAASEDTGSEGERPGAILQALNRLETIVAVHTEWLKNWHLEVLSGISAHRPTRITPPRLELPEWVDHPVLRNHPEHAAVARTLETLQRQSEAIADAVRRTGAIPTAEYGAFMNNVLAFASAVRHLQNDTWNQLANVDPLTGLGNRRAMWRKLRIECERQARNRHPCCLAMLDLDLFKEVNDRLGHAAGDAVLRSVAAMLTESVRPYDTAFRFGGDEFLLCLPSADLRAAWAIIERLRLKAANWLIRLKDSEEVSTTISVGIAPMEAETGVETALERADAALYSAKRHGRNRVCVWNASLR